MRVLPVMRMGKAQRGIAGGAVGAVAGMHLHQFFRVQQNRLSDLAGEDVLPCERLQLDGEVERVLQAAPHRDHAVIGQQTREMSLDRLDGDFRQRRRAEGLIARAGDVVAAETGDHVVERRDRLAQAAQRHAAIGVSVDNGLRFRPGAQDPCVKTPLARGLCHLP